MTTPGQVGSAFQAFGDVLGGISKSRSDSYQAQVAKNNAQIFRNNATYAGAAGNAATEQAGLKARSQLDNVKASQAANGLDVNSGSAASVQGSEREIGLLDTQTVAHNAALQQYGYQVQATNYDSQANVDKAAAAEDLWEGGINAAGTLAGSPSVAGAFSGGGAAPTGTGAQVFEPGATGVPASLLNGAPSVPEDYAWMQGGGNGALY